MRYEITGGQMPVVICYLENGESINTESGGMSWMSPNMQMQTHSGGGIGKMFGRMLSHETLFMNTYTAIGGPGEIAFASSFVGSIIPFMITPQKSMICQKSAYLAGQPGVELSVHFQKKIGSGFMGGEGFVMQRLSGNGLVFVEIDGFVVERTLAPGQQIVVSTGTVAAMEDTVQMDVKLVPGAKNMFFGGEGLFNTYLTGPGKVYLQTMPKQELAGVLSPYIMTNK
ncbi:MAG: TIGR00266 family protein [Ruminococcus sp.]